MSIEKDILDTIDFKEIPNIPSKEVFIINEPDVIGVKTKVI